MIALKIDPEFEKKIPPLTEAEYEQLQENILEDGALYDPIIVWNGTIIDGHNRWKIICDHWDLLKDRFRIQEMDFPDKWTAFDWMYRKQLGRRNLTEAQRTYMIGKLYEARKNTEAFKGNQYMERGAGQSDQHQTSHKERDETAGAIGREFGVGRRTVRRAGAFAKGVDALKSVSSDAAGKVLKGEVAVTKEEIRDIQKLSQETVEELAKAILHGDPIPRQMINRGRKPGGWTEEERRLQDETEAIVADMYDRQTIPEYTIESLVYEIQLCAKEYLQQIRHTFDDRIEILTDENKPIIADAIGHFIIDEFEKLRGELYERH